MSAIRLMFLTTVTLAVALAPIRTIHTFPPNHFIENLAVQANSSILVTSGSVPTLFRIDPLLANSSAQAPELVSTFPNATGLWGITEYLPDRFALTSGIWDLAATRATNLQIWTVDLSGVRPVARLITGVPSSTVLNGLTTVPGNTSLILAADSAAGSVYKIDLLSGTYSVAFSSPLFTPTGTVTLGINGVESSLRHLYFTNSAQGIFGRVPIDASGNQTGPVEVVSEAADAVPGGAAVYDDFALRGGHAWIASHPGFVFDVPLSGGQQKMIMNETLSLNPTSAAFGRGAGQQDILYVTNGGRFLPDFTLVDGGVVAVDMSVH